MKYYSAGRARKLTWLDSLRAQDATGVWKELYRVVRAHSFEPGPHSGGLMGAARDPDSEAAELTQELFLRLLSKNRFRHYLAAGLTDEDIEREIGQLELRNLMTDELRRRAPESYRLARRIAVLLRSSRRFRRFDAPRPAGRPLRLSSHLYGLCEWDDGKPTRAQDDMERRVRQIPVRGRDTRASGCAAGSQLIITSAELELLIASVLEAINAPADVRALRGLVMSRLPVLDYYQVPLERRRECEAGPACDTDEPADSRQNPEDALLERESELRGAGEVGRFLEALSARVRGKEKQYERITAVLWHCYLSPRRMTQLEVAEAIGVSDTLVSDYRRRIEQELRALSFTGLAEARAFEAGLRGQLERARFGKPRKSGGVSPQTHRHRRAS